LSRIPRHRQKIARGSAATSSAGADASGQNMTGIGTRVPRTLIVALLAAFALLATAGAGSAFASFGYLSQFGSSGSGNGQFENPIGVARLKRRRVRR
jgi:hypothetical protein